MPERPVSSQQEKIRIPPKAALTMVLSYARRRIGEQLRAVWFIVAYLVLFQTVVLRVPIASAVTVGAGIAMVVLGLAFFLEGLLLGIMPLGERVGVLLPVRRHAIIVLGFGLLVGFGATLAEPAIAVLRGVGESIVVWEAPLLYRMVQRHPDSLVAAIAGGVAVAVALGMVRFYAGYSIKPFVAVIAPLLIGVTVLMAVDTNLSRVIGLAWDAGAVTTGAVTVPLVLALSIGVSRSAGKGDAGGGFGVIMLASALPIIAVALLGMVLNRTTIGPMSEDEFFSPANRDQAVELLATEEALQRYAFQHGSSNSRELLWDSREQYDAELRRVATDAGRRAELLGAVPLTQWLAESASPYERSVIARVPREPERRAVHDTAEISFLSRAAEAARAIIPLTALLAFTLFVGLRSRPDQIDEVVMGVLFALVGMALLTAGIDQGLARLGDEVGRELPRTFQSDVRVTQRIIIEDFDTDLVFEAMQPDGGRYRFFYLERGGDLQSVEFQPQQLDAASGRYEHLIERVPLFSSELTSLGIALVLLFAFGLGFGATLAEPALDALGRTVEQLTVGTVKRKAVIGAVSVGVGLGLTAGVLRVIFDIPLAWLLLPPYAILLPLTLWSEEEFAGIAWDSGGVTTGPVTVPLVLAMGLSIGAEAGVVDGFGMLALASVFPILSVLGYGMLVRGRLRRAIRPSAATGEEHG